MILLIDNYDSFSYNLYQLIGTMDSGIQVIRNDELTVGQIGELNVSRIILSPGPGRPSDAGVCIGVVKEFAGKIPILGVCLGHQAICEAYGAEISHAKQLMHGKASTITVNNQCPVFKHLSDDITARYHSLAAKEGTLPKDLVVTARTQDGEIMAIRHKTHEVYGVQFHPESILTPDGETILGNFLNHSGIF